MTKVKIVAFSGSARQGSFNKKLLTTAVKGAEAAGATVTVIDLKEYAMPIYDGDLEMASGMPENAKKLKQIFADSDGILIASPEHNSSYSALLKNTLDWLSRKNGPDDKVDAFAGKYAGLVSTSPGALGGLRGLFALRELLQNLNVTVLSGMRSVGQANTIFDDTGTIKDEKIAANVFNVGKSLAETLVKLKG